MHLQTDLFLEPSYGDYTGVRDLEEALIQRFRDFIYEYYGTHGRGFPWRSTKDEYKILVSEIMLQQTQTGRVEPKYQAFISIWPDFPSLAAASLGDVYRAWQGLGYNRRAKALLDIARVVVDKYGGKLPSGMESLQSLPMVGYATAAAISAFAHGIAVPYLETNIRRVYIHFFFSGRSEVKDSELIGFVEQTLDGADPRNWYYALMDYGVFLKSVVANPNRRSAHYTRQAPFEGSDRQIRGSLLKTISEASNIHKDEIGLKITYETERVERCLNALVAEGLVVCENFTYRLGD